VRHLGEFGVVFLMFVIGLEFNLPKLRACARTCSGSACPGGLTIVLVTVGSLLPGRAGAQLWRMAGRARSRCRARWR
jgi:CPA2 family monovalent cation:H+ antiporter-2